MFVFFDTMPGEKKGLDKDIEERILAKYDPALEQKAIDWIAAILNIPSAKVLGNEGAQLFTWLKNGVILCNLLNALSPGVIPQKRIVQKPRNMLEERVTVIFFNLSHKVIYCIFT